MNLGCYLFGRQIRLEDENLNLHQVDELEWIP